jgi:signal transduction histidine kinase/CheY-like chemotaxis protein
MIQYVRSKIGLKLFLAFTTALVTCIFFVVLFNSYISRDFKSLVLSENESYVRDQALAFLTETTKLQAEKYEAVFQKIAATSRSNAKQVELLFHLAESPARVAPAVLPRLTPNRLNRILFNDESAPMMLCYWGGDTVPPRVAKGINLIARLAGTFKEATEINQEVIASHLIMTDGYGAYYPNVESVQLLPPVTELDLRDTNNYVLANPLNNPEHKTVWTPVYFDDVGNGLITTVTTPIYSAQDSFLGVAGLDIPLDRIQKLALSDEANKRSLPSQHGITFLLDNHGKFIFFPVEKLDAFGIEVAFDKFKNSFDLLNKGLLDSSLPEVRSLGDEIIESTNKSSRFLLRGEPYISSSELLPSNDWRLVKVIPEETFLAPIKAITSVLSAKIDTLSKQFYFTAILFLLGSLLMTVFLLQRFLLYPLQQVTLASEQIRKGELDARLEIDRIDEIGTLANTFNVMAESLRKSREAERTHSSDLELQVAEKTLDLENDIKRRKQVEAQLILAREKAELANQAKSNFLANMTHELRTPLIGVLGMNELLLNTPLNDQQRNLAVTVQNSGEILLTLINDVLDFSKIESNHLTLRCVPADISEITEETIRLCGEQALQKRLSLTYQISPEARRIVDVDPLRLRQILLNLISNAVKFTIQGEVVVRLSMAQNDARSGLFTIEIQDTGIGISTEDQEEMLKPFTQIDNAIDRKAGGTGLGLAIVQQLVELMGGKVEVESRVGDGTLFRVVLSLPLSDSQTNRNTLVKQFDRSQSEALNGLLEHAPAKRGRILVADDYPVTRELVRHFLEPRGYVIDEATSGREALEMAMSENYDLVLMDCNMPEMDGIESSRHLREKGNTVPIVALTAHIDSRILQNCLAVGMNDCLSKPFRRAELLEAVNNWAITSVRTS